MEFSHVKVVYDCSVKTPGGKLVYHYTKKLGTIPKCGDCKGCKLRGVSWQRNFTSLWEELELLDVTFAPPPRCRKCNPAPWLLASKHLVRHLVRVALWWFETAGWMAFVGQSKSLWGTGRVSTFPFSKGGGVVFSILHRVIFSKLWSRGEGYVVPSCLHYFLFTWSFVACLWLLSAWFCGAGEGFCQREVHTPVCLQNPLRDSKFSARWSLLFGTISLSEYWCAGHSHLGVVVVSCGVFPSIPSHGTPGCLICSWVAQGETNSTWYSWGHLLKCHSCTMLPLRISWCRFRHLNLSFLFKIQN